MIMITTQKKISFYSVWSVTSGSRRPFPLDCALARATIFAVNVTLFLLRQFFITTASPYEISGQVLLHWWRWVNGSTAREPFLACTHPWTSSTRQDRPLVPFLTTSVRLELESSFLNLWREFNRLWSLNRWYVRYARWCRRRVCRGCNRTPQSIDFEKPGKSPQPLGKIFENLHKLPENLSKKWRPTCFDLKKMAPELKWRALFGGHFCLIFFRACWKNLDKIPSHPQKFACSYTYGYATSKVQKKISGPFYLHSRHSGRGLAIFVVKRKFYSKCQQKFVDPACISRFLCDS